MGHGTERKGYEGKFAVVAVVDGVEVQVRREVPKARRRPLIVVVTTGETVS